MPRCRGHGLCCGGRRQCGDPADTQRRHAGRECHATPLVLVLPQWVPLFQGRGSQCFSFHGENQQHAIFGGGPSFSVHPSDLAPALVALDATFEVMGPEGYAVCPLPSFSSCPTRIRRGKTLPRPRELTGVRIPTPAASVVSTYLKITDREAWTHAEVSVAVMLIWRTRASAPPAWCWEASHPYRGA